MFIHGRIIKLNSVSTQQHLFVAGKQFQQLRIQLSDNIIFLSKNASIQKVLIIFVAMLNSRIDLLYQRIYWIIGTDQ